MRKTVTRVSILAAVCVALSACAVVPSQVGGTIYSRVTDPMMVTEAVGTKTGKACADNYLGIVSIGDMSIAAAKKDGKITKVASVDKVIEGNILIAKACTVVTGN
ncbi:TRL-like protein family protein [Parelusimicrobium proximum]|uniref:TRL-like family protein n=1 Tax=Parelusimicrobium proximum TaxID=3228953 RepID=UPI003D175FBB